MHKSKQSRLNWLKSLSIGQYKTNFYSNGSDSQSSIVGGIFTVVIGIIFGFAILIQLFSVFTRAHYNLELSLEQLSGNYLGGTFCEPCMKVKIKDYVNLMSGITLFINRIDLTTANCTKISLELTLDKQKTPFYVSPYKQEGKSCVFNFSS